MLRKTEARRKNKIISRKRIKYEERERGVKEKTRYGNSYMTNFFTRKFYMRNKIYMKNDSVEFKGKKGSRGQRSKDKVLRRRKRCRKTQEPGRKEDVKGKESEG